MAQEFRLPDLGEGIAEGQIVRILCAEGDTVVEDQAILEVETDKAAVEIPSPYGGKAVKIHVQEGQTVAVGEVLVTIEETNGSAPAAAPANAPAPESKPAPSPTPASAASPAPTPTRTPPPPVADAPRRTRAAAAPAVRKLARELGVDIDSLSGTGPGGRVQRVDVERAAGATPAAAPAAAPRPKIEGVSGSDNWGTTTRQKLSQIRKTIATQMVRSVSTIPHVTQTDEADITVLEGIRRDLRGEDGNGPRVTTMAFILKTLAHCLRSHPEFNASFDADNDEIIYKEYINIGIAVDSPRGLVVPVLRNVDRLSVLGIAEELRRVADKVRNVQFSIDELRGGSFTVTNYGAIGGIWGTPIINYPEVAILGIGRTMPQLRLSEEGDEIEARQILPLSLSFDHRATDGAQAARFLNDVVAHLSDPGLLLIK